LVELLTAIQFRAEPRTVIAARILPKRNPVRIRLDLEIALSGGSSEGSAPSGFSARPKMRWNVARR